MEALRQRMIEDGLADLSGMTADFPFVDNHCQTLGVDSSAMSARFIIATNKGPNRKNARLSLVKTRNGGGVLRENYDRNPVCCFDHGLNPFVSVPIGTSRNPNTGEVDLKITKSKAVGTVHFSQSLPQAEQIFRLIDEGIIRGSSVMLRPLKADLTEFSDDEDEESSFVLDIYESDLLEFGPVGIGADPDAIRSSIDSGNFNHVKNWLMLYAAEKPVQGIGMDVESFGSSNLGLNPSASSFADSLIRAGKVDKDSSWSFTAGDGDALLGEAGEDWSRYSRMHLGLEEGGDKESKAAFKFPYGKLVGGNPTVFRSGLIAARQRASQFDYKAIFDRAGSLLEKIDGKEEEKSSMEIDERLDRIEQALTDLAEKQSVRFGEEEAQSEEVVDAPENLEFTAKLEELNEVCSRQSESLNSLYTRLGGL